MTIGFLPGRYRAFTGTARASQVFEFLVNGGVRAGFVRLHHDNAVFPEGGQHFIRVGRLVDLAGWSTTGP